MTVPKKQPTEWIRVVPYKDGYTLFDVEEDGLLDVREYFFKVQAEAEAVKTRRNAKRKSKYGWIDSTPGCLPKATRNMTYVLSWKACRH
jgi:hypothetical protein